MHRYSELTKSQKAVIDGMRQNGVLFYTELSGKFVLQDERGFNIQVKHVTGNSLVLRGYVTLSRRIGEKLYYILNPDIQ